MLRQRRGKPFTSVVDGPTVEDDTCSSRIGGDLDNGVIPGGVPSIIHHQHHGDDATASLAGASAAEDNAEDREARNMGWYSNRRPNEGPANDVGRSVTSKASGGGDDTRAAMTREAVAKDESRLKKFFLRLVSGLVMVRVQLYGTISVSG